MGRTAKSKLLSLEPVAHEYYLTGKHDELLEAWEESHPQDRYKAPEAVFFAARVYIFRDNLLAAVNILDSAHEGFRRQNDSFGLARVYLAQAEISYHEANADTALQYINRALALVDDKRLRGEANLLMGEATIMEDSAKAMEYYNNAWNILRTAAFEDKKYNYYAVHASLRLANAALMRNDYEVAKVAQENARLLLAKMDDSLMSPFLVMQMANQMMQSGDFEMAWKYTSQIEFRQYQYQSPLLEARIHTVKAYMAWLCDDDKLAWRELTPVLNSNIDSEIVKGIMRVTHAHLHMSAGEYEEALKIAQGGRALSGDNQLLRHRFQILMACIRALAAEVNQTTLQEAEETLRFFKANFLQMEIAQSLLITAWVAKMLNEEDKTAFYLHELAKACSRTSTVNHIHRYWRLAYPFLADEWDALPNVETINDALKQFEKRFAVGINLQKERLMAFGYPTLWRGKRKILRGEVRAKYLLYMIEADEQSASREEILELLWPEAPLNVAIRNFGTLRAEIKEQLAGGLPTYEEGRYTLPENFPTYYDVGAFQEAIDLSKRFDDPSYRLAYLTQAIDLYQNHFANGITGKFVYEKACHYYYIVQLLIEDAIQLAEQTGRAAVKERLAEKRQWLLDNPPVERFPR